MMGGVQVIFTGDFFQLPPVMKVNDKIRHQHQYQHNNTSNTTSTNTYGYSQLTSMTQDINMTQNMSATATVASSSSTSSLSSSREQRFCFQSAIWKEMFSRKNCFMLKEVHRQKDTKFSKLLNAIRWGDCSGKEVHRVANNCTSMRCCHYNIFYYFDAIYNMKYLLTY